MQVLRQRSPWMNEKALPNVAYGQNHRFITRPYSTPATSEYAASCQLTSPADRGSRPARQPTHAQANIWNGIHGPTPPLIIAPPSSDSPQHEPEPGSERPTPPAPAGRTQASSPAVPGPSARNQPRQPPASPAARSPWRRSPSSDSSASTTATSNGSNNTNSQGASVCPIADSPAWSVCHNNGHPEDQARPRTRSRSSPYCGLQPDQGERVTASPRGVRRNDRGPLTTHAPGPWRLLRRSQEGQRRKDLRHLRCERRRPGDDSRRLAVTHQLALGQHQHA